MLLPGFFFLWFGVAAILIGVSALLIDWPWQLQVVGFVVLSAITALIGRRFYGTANGDTADPLLNLRGNRLEGRTFVLSEPIVEGQRAGQDRRHGLAGARARCAGRRADQGLRRRRHGADRDERVSACLTPAYLAVVILGRSEAETREPS